MKNKKGKKIKKSEASDLIQNKRFMGVSHG
jgi:hypothetical protein